jgi:quercetin dioxygenase-like cupin family protein
MADRGYRRVVSGLGADGRSAIVIDGPVPEAPSRAGRSKVVWRTASVPADNSGTGDIDPGEVRVSDLSGPGTLFMIQNFTAGHGGGEPFWHATDSIDYITMISGEVVFVTESGETTLRAGDVLVDRGIVHAWRNDGTSDAVASIVIVPALPVGKGRTH